MTKREFYLELESMFELDPGTVQGGEALAVLGDWDSVAVLTFLAMADEKLEVILSGNAVSACRSVEDLVKIVASKLTE